MPHSSWKEKCTTRFQEFVERRATNPTLSLNTATIQFLHRLIPRDHIEAHSHVPKHNKLSDADLSVLLEGPDMPLDIEAAITASADKYVGAWRIPVEIFPESEPHHFEIHHDPFEDAHPNHGMVFCNKGNPKCREAVSRGIWSVEPSSILFQQIDQEEELRQQTSVQI